MGYAGSQFHRGPDYLQDPLTPLTVQSFCNTEQSVTLTCPEGTTGDPVTATVAAGALCGYSTQEAADAAALAQAQAEAEVLREASPCITEVAGAMWGWGRNFRGALGVGNTSRQPQPALIGNSAIECVLMRAGGGFAMIIKDDGTLWAWGDNFSGQLGLGTQSIFPSTANNHLLPIQVGTDSDWWKVDCGESFVAALKTDGTLWTWGSNASGQLGLGDTTDRLVPTQIGTDTDWVQVAAGTDHMMALKSDGTLWGMGYNNGCLGNGTNVDSLIPTVSDGSDWAFISVQHSGVQDSTISIAIKTDGTIWGTGADFGPFAGGVGVILTWAQAGTDTDWASCGAGNTFGFAIKTDGTLWTAGWNFAGQLGQGNLTYLNDYTQVGTDTNWDTGSCGESFLLVNKTEGTLWGCGLNTNSELGQGGQSAAETLLIQIGSDDKWTKCCAGFNNGFALRIDLTPPAPAGENNGAASGGTYGLDGLYSINRFDANGTLTVYVDTTMDILRVGGGAGGGGMGGGGGGQVLKETGILVPAGTYTVSVPHYALGAFGGEDKGEQGGSVSFNGTTVLGGGAGAAGNAASDPDATGSNGASGGGGGMTFPDPNTDAFPGGTGTAGNDGGDAVTSGDPSSGGGGGGGGSGSAGSNASGDTGGNGGTGTSDSITGTAVAYGAGGGGAGFTTKGSGGSSMGGNGAEFSSETRATAGISAGSGGGGTFRDFFPIIENQTTAGSGAPGTVIVRYLTPT